MTFDLSKLDKSNFVNIKFSDNSIYYGEVAWFNESNEQVQAPSLNQSNISDPQNPSNTETDNQYTLNKPKMLRHGNGAQIFLRQDDTVLCKYEGEWKLDLKSGNGVTMYPDGAWYYGILNNEEKEGYGKYVWPNGDCFNGTWKNDRMDGPGVFIQSNGNRLEGSFKNNYFHMGGNRYVNPLAPQKEIEEFVAKKGEIEKVKETRNNEKNFFVRFVRSRNKMKKWIDHSRNNDRIPLVISTKTSGINIRAFQSKCERKGKKSFFVGLK